MAKDVQPPMEHDEVQLIRDIVSGHQEAYAELVRRHMDMIISLCASILHSRSEAEDAAQDIFVKAYTRLSAFRQDSSFSTWLYRIAYRYCLDLLKYKRRHPADSWDALVDQKGDAAHPGADDKTLERMGHHQLLRQALEALPADYQLVLTLREVQGLSYEDMAQATSSSLDAVKSRLKRARQALQEKARHFFQAPIVQIAGETR